MGISCLGSTDHPANGFFKDHIHEKKSLVEQQNIRQQFKSISLVWNFHFILPTNGKKPSVLSVAIWHLPFLGKSEMFLVCCGSASQLFS